MAQIVACVVDIVSKADHRPIVAGAMNAILAIARNAQVEEEAVLTTIIPVVLNDLKDGLDRAELMSIVPVLMYAVLLKSIIPVSYAGSSKLGPRIIAHLSPIVEACISVFESSETG